VKNRFVLWIGFLVPFLWGGCTQKTPISGTLTVASNTPSELTVYLLSPNGFSNIASPFLGTIIDSSEVDANGNFAFRKVPETSETLLLEIALQKKGNRGNFLSNETPMASNYMPVVWQPGETLEITASVDHFQQSFSLQNPSEANAELLKLRDIKLEAFQQYLENKEWNVEEGSQLLEREQALFNYQKMLMEFASQTKQLFPALVAVRWVSPQQDYERTAEFLYAQCEQWKEVQPNHPWVQQLCKKADTSVLPVLVNSTFPNTSLPMVSGETTDLYPQLGSALTLIDLWASWCVPCRKENREVLVPLWETYHEKGFQIVAYGLESSEASWKAAIEKDGAHRWLHASHLQGDDAPFMKTLRIQTIPANFLLDANGKVLAKNLHGEELTRWVRDYME